MSIATGSIGGSKRIDAAAPVISDSDMTKRMGKRWDDAIANSIPLQIINGGPLKENILKGADIDIFRFPHPIRTWEEIPPELCRTGRSLRRIFGLYGIQRYGTRSHYNGHCTEEQSRVPRLCQSDAPQREQPHEILRSGIYSHIKDRLLCRSRTSTLPKVAAPLHI